MCVVYEQAADRTKNIEEIVEKNDKKRSNWTKNGKIEGKIVYKVR